MGSLKRAEGRVWKTPNLRSGCCPQILLAELARAFFPAPPSAVPVVRESTIVSGACCRFSPPLRRLVRFLGESPSTGVGDVRTTAKVQPGGSGLCEGANRGPKSQARQDRGF